MMLWLCSSRTTAFACQYACLQLHSNLVSFNQKACPHALEAAGGISLHLSGRLPVQGIFSVF
jgi:hypothetical protein